MLLGSPSVAISRGHISFGGFVRVVLDPLLIVLCLVLSCAAAGSGFGAAELVLAVIVFSLTFPSEVSLHKLQQNLFGTIFINWILLVALLLFFGYATKSIATFDLHMLAIWFVSTPFVLYGAHRAIPILVPQLLAIDGYRSAVIVAANEVGRRLAVNLTEHPALGFRFLGFFDDGCSGETLPLQSSAHFSQSDRIEQSESVYCCDPNSGCVGEGDVPVKQALAPEPRGGVDVAGPLLGTIDAASSFVKANRVEAVFIALPMAAQPRLLQLLDEIKDTTASVYFVPDIFITDLINARIDDINGMPVMAVCESPIVGMDAVLKRVFDVAVSLTALTLLAPVMLAIAIGIKLGPPGPILFRQRRYGLDGRQIVVWKFRTMTVVEDGGVVRQATKDDQRVTRLGALLRKTSLDELPQLFNVLVGSMSLVGPRPHAVAHNEQYRGLIKGYMVRHKVKPGITGWAQVNGLRGETDSIDKMHRRIEYDIEYLRRWSLGLDMLILCRTAIIVFQRTNAY
ncbi:MAG TPA: undecaprenyl-phosphate glucose phosphotransferase [Burkholderiaceae bacterium]|nr:undecaprenyl-phosphate glucose phosphotransferase [Burkholderiaceae bacterium]